MYSRLDLFLVDHYYVEYVKAVTIKPITISDHAPVMLTLVLVAAGHHERKWRLNESMLDDKEIGGYTR